MSGEEFLNWLDGVKFFDKVEWIVHGDDCLDADQIEVAVTADGETKQFRFGSPKKGEYPDDFCRICMAMIANRIMRQSGRCSQDESMFHMSDDPCNIVNQSIDELLGGDF